MAQRRDSRIKPVDDGAATQFVGSIAFENRTSLAESPRQPRWRRSAASDSFEVGPVLVDLVVGVFDGFGHVVRVTATEVVERRLDAGESTVVRAAFVSRKTVKLVGEFGEAFARLIAASVFGRRFEQFLADASSSRVIRGNLQMGTKTIRLTRAGLFK